MPTGASEKILMIIMHLGEEPRVETMGTWRTHAQSRVGMGTLTVPQNFHEESSLLLPELSVVSKIRSLDF